MTTRGAITFKYTIRTDGHNNGQNVQLIRIIFNVEEFIFREIDKTSVEKVNFNCIAIFWAILALKILLVETRSLVQEVL